jgi:hypothetical protein
LSFVTSNDRGQNSQRATVAAEVLSFFREEAIVTSVFLESSLLQFLFGNPYFFVYAVARSVSLTFIA